MAIGSRYLIVNDVGLAGALDLAGFFSVQAVLVFCESAACAFSNDTAV